MTIVYLIRHSKPNKHVLFEEFMSPLKKNMKQKLSEEGIKIATDKLSNLDFNDVDVIYSSNYNRTYSTASILANRLNKKIIVDKRFGERIHGIKKSYSELPNDFEQQQLSNELFKYGNGENQLEVRNRMYEGLNNALGKNKDKTIAIFTHSTATLFLLLKWSTFLPDNKLAFKDKVYFDGNWDYCEIFKLEFDSNNELLSIQNI